MKNEKNTLNLNEKKKYKDNIDYMKTNKDKSKKSKNKGKIEICHELLRCQSVMPKCKIIHNWVPAQPGPFFELL